MHLLLSSKNVPAGLHTTSRQLQLCDSLKRPNAQKFNEWMKLPVSEVATATSTTCIHYTDATYWRNALVRAFPLEYRLWGAQERSVVIFGAQERRYRAFPLTLTTVYLSASFSFHCPFHRWGECVPLLLYCLFCSHHLLLLRDPLFVTCLCPFVAQLFSCFLSDFYVYLTNTPFCTY